MAAKRWLSAMMKCPLIPAFFGVLNVEDARSQGYKVEPLVPGLNHVWDLLTDFNTARKYFHSARDLRDTLAAPFRWTYDFTSTSHPLSAVSLSVLVECIP